MGGIPLIGSATAATALVGQPFSYQMVASGDPTSYAATGLPAGWQIDKSTGLITGTPDASQIGAYSVNLTATNSEGTSAPHTLMLTIPAPLQLVSAASRKTHESAGPFDIDLPLTGSPGVECRNGDRTYQIVLTFNNRMVRARSSVTSGTGSTNNFPPFLSGTVFSQELYNVSDQQSMTVMFSGLADEFGQTLPDQAVTVKFLIGDTSGNSTVNASDVGQTKSLSGAAVTAATFRGDVNVNGAINASDVAQVKANSGHSLP